MSLAVDIAFNKVLSASSAVTALVDTRIYNTARPTTEDNEDKMPYIIIMFEGLQNEETTKDDTESIYDDATVSILCAATSRDGLAELTNLVRSTIHSNLLALNTLSWQFEIDGYTFSAGGVSFDDGKPCYYQTLTYQVQTSNLN